MAPIHTIRRRLNRLSFLYFEALLNIDKINYDDLSRFFEGAESDLAGRLNPEFKEYLSIIKYNGAAQEAIFNVLIKYNNNFIKSTNEENRIFSELVLITKKLFPNLEPVVIVSSLFSAFFTHALVTLKSCDLVENALV